MNFLITAGGTNEKIDDVRYITNHATGRLGKIIAETCLEHPEINVYYVYGENALLPEKQDRLHLFPIQSVDELKKQLESLLTEHTFYSVIHSMAVSDYYAKKTFSAQQLVKAITVSMEAAAPTDSIQQTIRTALGEIQTANEKKISSEDTQLFIELAKAPKVISFIKKWQPETKLVGFKLLVGVSQQELIDTAYQQLQKNKCEFVLANDLTTIHNDQHIGFLVDHQKKWQVYSNKKAIAEGLISKLLNSKSESNR